MPAALRYAFQSSASSSSSALRSVELHQFDHCTKCATGRRQGTDDTELLALEVLKQHRGEALQGFGRTSGLKSSPHAASMYLSTVRHGPLGDESGLLEHVLHFVSPQSAPSPVVGGRILALPAGQPWEDAQRQAPPSSSVGMQLTTNALSRLSATSHMR